MRVWRCIQLVSNNRCFTPSSPIELNSKLRVLRCVEVLFVPRCFAPSASIEFYDKLRLWRSVHVLFLARCFVPSAPIELLNKLRVWRRVQVVFDARYLAVLILLHYKLRVYTHIHILFSARFFVCFAPIKLSDKLKVWSCIQVVFEAINRSSPLYSFFFPLCTSNFFIILRQFLLLSWIDISLYLLPLNFIKHLFNHFVYHRYRILLIAFPNNSPINLCCYIYILVVWILPAMYLILSVSSKLQVVIFNIMTI